MSLPEELDKKFAWELKNNPVAVAWAETYAGEYDENQAIAKAKDLVKRKYLSEQEMLNSTDPVTAAQTKLAEATELAGINFNKMNDYNLSPDMLTKLMFANAHCVLGTNVVTILAALGEAAKKRVTEGLLDPTKSVIPGITIDDLESLSDSQKAAIATVKFAEKHGVISEIKLYDKIKTVSVLKEMITIVQLDRQQKREAETGGKMAAVPVQFVTTPADSDPIPGNN